MLGFILLKLSTILSLYLPVMITYFLAFTDIKKNYKGSNQSDFNILNTADPE